MKQVNETNLQNIFDEGQDTPQEIIREFHLLIITEFFVVFKRSFQCKNGSLQFIIIKGKSLIDLEVKVMK